MVALVLTQAKNNARRNAPMAETRDSSGVIHAKPHEFCGTNVGCNRCCPSIFTRQERDTGDLVPYGLGVMLFFQFAKAMAYLFSIMTIFAIPVVLILYASSVERDNALADTEDARGDETITDILARFSPAALGELTGQCRENTEISAGSNPLLIDPAARRRLEGEDVWTNPFRILQDVSTDVAVPGVVEIACPAGTRVASIEAVYGTPTGSCNCPASQTPDVDGVCPASRSGTGCEPSSGACFYSATRPLETPEGTVLEVGECCAKELNDRGVPDFSSLDIEESEECNLLGAQRIAEMRCLRRDSCTLSANRFMLQPWIEDEDGDINRKCSPSERILGDRWRTASTVEMRRELLSASGMDPDNHAGAWQACANFAAGPPELTTATSAIDPVTNVEETDDDTNIASIVFETFSEAVTNASIKCNQVRGSAPLRLMVVAQCLDLDIDVFGLVVVKKEDMALIMVIFDLIITATFIIGVVAIGRRQKEEDRETSFATPSDYTVRIEQIPPHDSLKSLEAAIRNGMETYLSQAQPIFRPLPQGVKIADINFGLDSVDMTEAKVQHGKVATKLQAAASELAIRGITWGQVKASPEYKNLMETGGGCVVKCCGGRCIPCFGNDMLRLAVRIEKLKRRLELVHEEVEEGRKDTDVVARAINAYVTFEEEEAVFRAKSEYPDSGCYAACCMPREAQIQTTEDGKTYRTSLRVSRADEPSDIAWENMRYEKGLFSALRRYFTVFLFVVVLAAAGALVLFIEKEKATLERQFPPVECGSMEGDTSDKKAVVVDEFFDWFGAKTGRTGRLECFCRVLLENSTNPVVLFNEPFPIPTTEQAAKDHAAEVLSNPLFFEIVSDTSTDFDTSGSTQFTPPASAGWTNSDLPDGWEADDLCTEWVNTFGQLQASFYGGALLVIVMNSSFPEIVRRLVRFMKLPSGTEMLRYNTFFLFIAMVVNTGLMAVVVNARIDEPVIRDLAIGNEDDFDTSWFSSVGASLMLTMALNVILNQVSFLRLAVLRWWMQWHDQHYSLSRNSDLTRCITQEQLNKKWLGPEWPLAEIYSSLLNVIFVCLMFSAGLPLMIPVAALYCIFFFWTQKYMFLRVFRRPPMYDQSLALMVNSLLPWALILHFLFGAWMVSNGAIFLSAEDVTGISIAPEDGTLQTTTDSSSGAESGVVTGISEGQSEATRGLSFIEVGGYNIGSRLSSTASLLMIVVGALLLLYLIIRNFFFHLFKALGVALLRIICPCRSCFAPDDDEFEGLRNYFDAIPDRILNDFKHRRHLPKRSLWPHFEAAVESRRAARESSEGSIQELHDLAEVIHMAEMRRLELRNQVNNATMALNEARNDYASTQAMGKPVPPSVAEAIQVWDSTLIHYSQELHALEEDLKQVKARHRQVGAYIRSQRRRSATESRSEEMKREAEERTKTLGSTVYSYDIDCNPEYERKFGFDVLIHDRTLSKEVAKFMPRRDGVNAQAGSTMRITSGLDVPAFSHPPSSSGAAGAEAVHLDIIEEDHGEGALPEHGHHSNTAHDSRHSRHHSRHTQHTHTNPLQPALPRGSEPEMYNITNPATGEVEFTVEIPAEFAADPDARQSFIDAFVDAHRSGAQVA